MLFTHKSTIVCTVRTSYICMQNNNMLNNCRVKEVPFSVFMFQYERGQLSKQLQNVDNNTVGNW